MSLTWNPASDLAQFDGLELVTLRQPGAATTTPIAGALRRQATTAEAAPSGGAATATDTVWHLPAEAVAEPPRLGATLTDAAGRSWTVLTAALETLGARWRCGARRLAIDEVPETLVTLERAVWQKSADGAPTVTWATVATDVRARVQPIRGEVVVEHARRQVRASHRIYLAAPRAREAMLRVQATVGVLYVVGDEGAARIDGHQVLLATTTENPWAA
jgi:hypothetical protein